MATNSTDLPFVSICTPTFNRRPFFPSLIQCVEQQKYPSHKYEWIIIDDGTDHIEDLVKHIPTVKYFKFPTKMSLGKKRNLMHDMCCGDIIVYMDDDDYYPPTRLSHAVDMLESHPGYELAGCLELPIYFHKQNQIYITGPYGTRRITAATFAFRRSLLMSSRYDETASIAEERSFLNGYTIPVVTLQPIHTILVFSHPHNTFDKDELLEQTGDVENNPYIHTSKLTVGDFIHDVELYEFYVVKLWDILAGYEEGTLTHKPDVVIQKQNIQITRLTRRLTMALTENARLHKLNSTLSDIVKKQLRKPVGPV